MLTNCRSNERINDEQRFANNSGKPVMLNWSISFLVSERESLPPKAIFDDEADYINIPHFIVAANIIDLTNTPFPHNQIYCLAVVFYIKPIANVQALAIQ